MLGAKKNDYFEMMETLVGFCTQSASYLYDYLANFDPEQIATRRAELHAIEHKADESRHGTLEKLSREFITPIERDDLLQLIQIIDDVTDAIDEVGINLYMYNLRSIPADTLKLADVVKRCTHALTEAVCELRHFKRSSTLQKLLVDVNTLESEADEIYIEAMRALTTSGQDATTIIGVREIYDCLENCCDLCEHAADVIENTVMKNT